MVVNPGRFPAREGAGGCRGVSRRWGSCCTSGRESSSCTAPSMAEGVGVGSGWVTTCLSNFSSFPNLLFQAAKRAGNEEKNFAVSQAGRAPPQICPLSPTSKQGALLTILTSLFGFVCFYFSPENICERAWEVKTTEFTMPGCGTLLTCLVNLSTTQISDP